MASRLPVARAVRPVRSLYHSNVLFHRRDIPIRSYDLHEVNRRLVLPEALLLLYGRLQQWFEGIIAEPSYSFRTRLHRQNFGMVRDLFLPSESSSVVLLLFWRRNRETSFTITRIHHSSLPWRVSHTSPGVLRIGSGRRVRVVPRGCGSGWWEWAGRLRR